MSEQDAKHSPDLDAEGFQFPVDPASGRQYLVDQHGKRWFPLPESAKQFQFHRWDLQQPEMQSQSDSDIGHSIVHSCPPLWEVNAEIKAES